jgi:hypothetical protein
MFSLESKSLGYYLILEEPEADFLEDVFGYNITESLSLELDYWDLSTYTWLRVFLFSSISKNCYYCIVAERLESVLYLFRLGEGCGGFCY